MGASVLVVVVRSTPAQEDLIDTTHTALARTHLHDFGDSFGLLLRGRQHAGKVDDVGHLLVFGGEKESGVCVVSFETGV